MATKEALVQVAEILNASGKELKAIKNQENPEKERSIQTIYDNSVLFLLKNGLFFYTGTESVEKAKDIYLCVDRTTYQIDINKVKKEFGKEADSILKKGFRKNKYNNEVSVKAEEKRESLKEKEQKPKKSPVKIPTDSIYDGFLVDKPKPKKEEKPVPVHEKPIPEKKPEEDSDLLHLDFDEEEPKEPEKKIRKEDVQIRVEDLLMDVFQVTLSGEKPITIIAAPIEKREGFVPMFLFAKADKTAFVSATEDNSKPSCQISIENHLFMVKGKWDSDDFTSVLYAPGIDSSDIEIKKKQLRPKASRTIGHQICYREPDMAIHILPLSSRNSDSGKLGFLACLENQKERKLHAVYINGQAEVPYENQNYKIRAIWEDRKLLSDISVSSCS